LHAAIHTIFADVRVIEGGGGPGFALKPRKGLAIRGQSLRQEFEGDEPAELSVQGLIDDTHPSGAQPLHNPVVRNGLA